MSAAHPRLLVAFVVCAAVAGCARAAAKNAPPVTLVTPAPPARVAVPVPLPEPEAQPAPPPPAPVADARPREVPPPRSDRPAPAPPPATAPTQTAEAPSVLQTTPDTSAVDQRTRALIDEAQGNLDRVKYRELGASARAQYDSAASFVRSARQALTIKNYLYAEYLAAKAAAVARELVK